MLSIAILGRVGKGVKKGRGLLYGDGKSATPPWTGRAGEWGGGAGARAGVDQRLPGVYSGRVRLH